MDSRICDSVPYDSLSIDRCFTNMGDKFPAEHPSTKRDGFLVTITASIQSLSVVTRWFIDWTRDRETGELPNHALLAW